MKDLGRRVARLEKVAGAKPGKRQPTDTSWVPTDLLLRLEESRWDLSQISDGDLDELEAAALEHERARYDPK